MPSKVSRTRIQQMKDSILLSDFIRHTCPDLPNDTRRNKYCICPFHKEKTASLMVNDRLKKFYCFGCGASGDHISFIYYKFYNNTRNIWNQRDDMCNIKRSENREPVHKVFMKCARKLSQITGIPMK